MDLDEGLDGGEPGLTRITPVGHDPIDIVGGRIGAGLDAAMALLDGGFYLEFGGRRGVEVVFGIGFERRLVAPEGEHIIGLVGDDLVSDLDLTAHGIDGHQRTFDLLGLGKFIEEIRDGGDLVGLFRHAELRQDQSCRGRH